MFFLIVKFCWLIVQVILDNRSILDTTLSVSVFQFYSVSLHLQHLSHCTKIIELTQIFMWIEHGKIQKSHLQMTILLIPNHDIWTLRLCRGTYRACGRGPVAVTGLVAHRWAVTRPASCRFPFTLLPSPANLPKSKCKHACKQNFQFNELMVWLSLSSTCQCG